MLFTYITAHALYASVHVLHVCEHGNLHKYIQSIMHIKAITFLSVRRHIQIHTLTHASCAGVSIWRVQHPLEGAGMAQQSLLQPRQKQKCSTWQRSSWPEIQRRSPCRYWISERMGNGVSCRTWWGYFPYTLTCFSTQPFSRCFAATSQRPFSEEH